MNCDEKEKDVVVVLFVIIFQCSLHFIRYNLLVLKNIYKNIEDDN